MAVVGGATTDGLKQKIQKKKFVDFAVTYFEIFNGDG